MSASAASRALSGRRASRVDRGCTASRFEAESLKHPSHIALVLDMWGFLRWNLGLTICPPLNNWVLCHVVSRWVVDHTCTSMAVAY